MSRRERPPWIRRARVALGSPAVALIAAYGLLLTAWVMSAPPTSGNDETEHFIKATGIAYGQILGEDLVPADRRQWMDRSWLQFGDDEFGSASRRYLESVSRVVTIPASLRPPQTSACFAFHPAESAACLTQASERHDLTRVATYMATRGPASYLIPAVAIRLSRSSFVALRLARGVTAMTWILFVGCALWLTRVPRGQPWLVLGAVAAITPMYLYHGAMLGSSALELSAAFAVLCGILDLQRNRKLTSAGWRLTGSATVALAVARPTGPVFVITYGLFAAIILGRAGIRDLVQGSRRTLVAFFVATIASMALSVAWQVGVEEPSPFGIAGWPSVMDEAFGSIPVMLRQTIGVFGEGLDTELPLAVYATWTMAVVGLIGLAMRIGTKIQRRIIMALIAGGTLAFVADFIFLAYPFRGIPQARWVLPILIMIPLYAGEVIRQCPHGVQQFRRPLSTMVYVLMSLHIVSLVAAARRYATGLDGPWLFAKGAEWTPPLGWGPWLVVALASILPIGVLTRLRHAFSPEVGGSLGVK